MEQTEAENRALSDSNSSESTDDLRRLQIIELDILRQFLRICRDEGLSYYMLGGTLLGAVRHRGFIPWDDDIDIGMPRPDYERFLQIAQSTLRLPYQLHTLQSGTGEYAYYYARIENISVKLMRRTSFKDVIIPAWIDVFPLDGVPDDERKRNVWIKKCSFLQNVFLASQFSYLGLKERKRRAAWKTALRQFLLTTHAETLISTKWAWKELDKALKENAYDNCSTIINFCGYWKLKEMFPKDVYGKGKLYAFEDLMLCGPENYDYVLSQMYGDYMTPIPPGEREHHRIELLQ